MPKVDFLVVGAQKAGTTALHRMLGQHPELFMPDNKELHYFDSDNIDWSSANHTEYESQFAKATQGQLCGEATPAYMYLKRFTDRIASYNPNIKVIAVLRNPVDRAWSNWRMERTRNAESHEFSYAIREGRNRIVDNWRVYSYVERGLYAEQVDRLQNTFSRSGCHFLTNEELRSNPMGSLNEIADFLGVNVLGSISDAFKEIRPLESGHFGSMSPEDREYLWALYLEDIERTSELLGRDLMRVWRAA